MIRGAVKMLLNLIKGSVSIVYNITFGDSYSTANRIYHTAENNLIAVACNCNGPP